MVLLFLIIAFIIGGVLLEAFCDSNGAGAIVSMVFILVLLCSFVFLGGDYEAFYENYTTATYELNQTGGEILTNTQLEDVLDVNSEILANQQKLGNIFNGIYYSKQIAETPLIPID